MKNVRNYKGIILQMILWDCRLVDSDKMPLYLEPWLEKLDNIFFNIVHANF